MKLILLTTPRFFVEEDKILTDLFDEGLDVLHVRKPGEEPIYFERLLTLLPKHYRRQIVTHEHFYLKEEFQLMGIHTSRYNPTEPDGYKGHKSETVHHIDELREAKKRNSYVFLSPIFDSITNTNYKAGFTTDELRQASKEGLIDKKVMALGGIEASRIRQLKELGFGGAVLSGDIWSKFNIHSTTDYKEVLEHFRELRRAVG